jgi:hypothetical protein
MGCWSIPHPLVWKDAKAPGLWVWGPCCDHFLRLAVWLMLPRMDAWHWRSCMHEDARQGEVLFVHTTVGINKLSLGLFLQTFSVSKTPYLFSVYAYENELAHRSPKPYDNDRVLHVSWRHGLACPYLLGYIPYSLPKDFPLTGCKGGVIPPCVPWLTCASAAADAPSGFLFPFFYNRWMTGPIELLHFCIYLCPVCSCCSYFFA